MGGWGEGEGGKGGGGAVGSEGRCDVSKMIYIPHQLSTCIYVYHIYINICKLNNLSGHALG